MEIKTLKTINWSECEALLKVPALENLGQLPTGKTNSFVDFVCSYPKINHQQWLSFWQNVMQCHRFNDVTDIATNLENSCLFSYKYDTALDIVLYYLKTLNSGKKLASLWCFLDDEKKAVVHFINRDGWYAEAFFACNENFSVLHLIETAAGLTFFPVVFATDITEKILQAETLGDVVLHTYLPREVYDFLSNKSGKKNKKQLILPEEKAHYSDDGDLL